MSSKRAPQQQCATCSALFTSTGGRPICSECHDTVNATIREMLVAGRSSTEIAARLGLALSNVKNRAYHIRQDLLSAGVRSVIVAIPRKPKGPCKRPSGNPAREMHICCRVPGEIACSAVHEGASL